MPDNAGTIREKTLEQTLKQTRRTGLMFSAASALSPPCSTAPQRTRLHNIRTRRKKHPWRNNSRRWSDDDGRTTVGGTVGGTVTKTTSKITRMRLQTTTARKRTTDNQKARQSKHNGAFHGGFHNNTFAVCPILRRASIMLARYPAVMKQKRKYIVS
jgi:hypothetical protein